MRSVLPELPRSGAVLGVDIGYSQSRRSSAVCRLDWTDDAATWEIERFKAAEPERTETLHRLADRPLLAAALDGPLARGFGVIGHHRAAERMLTLKIGPRIGKPGSSAAPVGKDLNRAANIVATILLATGHIASASHEHRIDCTAIVEAFPGAALGLMIAAPQTLLVKRGNRSDKFYTHLVESGGFARLFEQLLPGRRPKSIFTQVTNHDARAALVCALTALGLAAGMHTAVGDDDGWIILPPRALVTEDSWRLLEANATDGAGQLFDAADPSNSSRR